MVHWDTRDKPVSCGPVGATLTAQDPMLNTELPAAGVVM